MRTEQQGQQQRRRPPEPVGPDGIVERGLPVSLDAERLILGSILLDDRQYLQVAGDLVVEDFSLEKHRRIFRRMGELQDRGERIDRVTLAKELGDHGELESVDGLGYLVSLDDGLPAIPHLDAYIRQVKKASNLRRLALIGQNLTNQALMGGADPQEVLDSIEENLLKLSAEGIAKKRGLATPERIIQEYEGGASAFLDPARRKGGLATGLAKFDEYTGGLHRGDLFILAARPSMGKTALALNIATHAAVRKRKATAIFSLEMSRESLLNRMVCSISRVDSWRYRMGYIQQDERRRLSAALAELTEAPLHIDDTAGLNLMEMHAKLRRLQAEQGELGLVIVDYLQLMSSRGKVENRNQEVSALSRGLKLMAKELDVPMMALSQLSRAVETRTGDHRPQLQDLRESGSIEQDADLVGFIFREEVYRKDREDLRGLAELIIAKQRNGPIGTANLVWLAGQGRFENRAEDETQEPQD